MTVDIVIGLQYGDEGKGKVVLDKVKNKEYDLVVRFNGGPNAGHTVYNNNKEIVVHGLPIGLIYGIKSLIGPCCVIDLDKLEKEIKYLEEKGIKNVRENLLISNNTHIIKREHIEEDNKREDVGNGIGSTRSGIGPVYRDKHARIGMRYEEVKEKKYKMVDAMKTIEGNDKILFEGAQGMGLDIDWGDYPYVTSSNCGISSVINSGLDFNRIENVIGVAKIYETYVGNKVFQPECNRELEEISEKGNEIGSTTGRKRQCNWLDTEKLVRYIKMNSITELIINKCDIIEQVGIYRTIDLKFETFEELRTYISVIINTKCKTIKNIRWSYSSNKI